uniref:Uncharacterized protein n=1 Tax=Hucho hucho TaxID=62062 RepID=A0A4W5NRC8_9TELE
MLQGPHVLGHEMPLIRLSFTSCVVGTASLPLLGVITCIFISSVKIINHFPNDLRSTSASISLSPEHFTLGTPGSPKRSPRVLIPKKLTSIYKGLFSTRFIEWLLSCLNCIYAITENFGLLLLTYVSSNETYPFMPFFCSLIPDSLQPCT